MSPKKTVAPTPGVVDLSNMHGVCSAGGSRAILASAGHLLACHMAGITEWQTIGGVSGGSIPTALLAGGVEPAQMLRFAVEVDFSSLVPRHATPLSTIFAFLLKDRFELTRPKRGVLSSDNLGTFIDEWVPEWPKNYWTMAVVARTQVVFTADGVYQYLRNGQRRVLSDKPAPVGLAVRASCAIPGIIDSVQFRGRHLFDGALSWDGACPVGVVSRHYGAEPQSIVACDVGDDPKQHRLAPLVTRFWGMLCGGHCLEQPGAKDNVPEGVIMAKPNVWSVRSLQFHLTVEQKWQAVMSGFQEAVGQLSRAGLLTGDRLQDCLAVCADIEKLKAMAK